MHLQRPQVLQHQINAAALAQASALAAASAAAISASSNVNTAVTSAAGTASLLNNNTSIQLSRQQEVRLQQLQLERERLKLRQQEIMQQVRSPSSSSSSNFNEVCSYIIFDETCDFVNVCRWRRNRLVYVSKIDFRWLIICCLNQIHTCTCEFCIDCCLVFFLHSKWRMVK